MLRLALGVVATGVVSGFLVVAFKFVVVRAEFGREALLAWAHTSGLSWLLVLGVVLAAGVAAGFLSSRVPEAARSGVPHVRKALQGTARLRWSRLVPAKFFGSTLAIGAGFSLGYEGPAVQIGAAAGEMAGRLLLSRDKGWKDYFIAGGAASGIAAAFNAPVAGIAYVFEELGVRFCVLGFVVISVAAVVAAFVSDFLRSPHLAFWEQGAGCLSPKELSFAALLGILAGTLAHSFTRFLEWCAEVTDKLTRRWPPWARPLPACSFVAVFGWYLPMVLGSGRFLIAQALHGVLPPNLIIILLFSKSLLTGASYGAGVPGGLFLPLLSLGALLGALFAHAASFLVHVTAGIKGLFLSLGMIAFFTAATRAPLTGVILALEASHGRCDLISLLLACTAAFSTADLLGNLSLSLKDVAA